MTDEVTEVIAEVEAAVVAPVEAVVAEVVAEVKTAKQELQDYANTLGEYSRGYILALVEKL